MLTRNLLPIACTLAVVAGTALALAPAPAAAQNKSWEGRCVIVNVDATPVWETCNPEAPPFGQTCGKADWEADWGSTFIVDTEGDNYLKVFNRTYNQSGWLWRDDVRLCWPSRR